MPGTSWEIWVPTGLLLTVFAVAGVLAAREKRKREADLAKNQPRWDRAADEEDRLRELRRRKLELEIAILEHRLEGLRRAGESEPRA